jgi:hypothetical protein
MIKPIVDFNYFLSINESKKSVTQKGLGVHGPDREGSFEIISGENKPFSFRISEKDVAISSSDKTIIIPKNSCKISKSTGGEVLKTLPFTNWFREEKNLDSFEDFVYSVTENYFRSNNKVDNILDNLEVLLEEMEIDLFVNTIEKKNETTYEILFSNGMEAECIINPDLQFIKTVKIYKGNGSEDPLIKVSLLKNEVSGKFSSDVGKFTENADCFADLIKNPIFKYLTCVLTDKKNQDVEDYVINYYKRLMKYHHWKESLDNDAKQDRHRSERKEIDRIREILKHTHEDEELERLFVEAKESFMSSHQNS